MADSLSPSELDLLFSPREAAVGGGPPLSAASPAHPSPPGIAARLPRDVMEALRRVHNGWGPELQTEWSALLRAPVQVRLAEVDQPAFEEFVLGRASSAALFSCRTAPLSGTFLLQAAPSLMLPLLDRLLGGDGRVAVEGSPRAYTGIEASLSTRIAEGALRALRTAWAAAAALEPITSEHQCDPRSTPGMVPDARLAVATCDVTVGESRGELQVAYPLAGLAPVLDDLRRYARTPEAGSGGPATAGTEARALLSVRLAVTRLSQMELRDLAVGDVLVTDWPSNRPMSVRVDGVPQFEGTGGIFQGRKAVRISGEAAEETARADLDNPSEPVAPRWANASSCPEKRGKTPLPGANSQ